MPVTLTPVIVGSLNLALPTPNSTSLTPFQAISSTEVLCSESLSCSASLPCGEGGITLIPVTEV